ncbi:CHASE4 domain-containing protein [Elusimicrobiota bacterium]
MRTKSKISFLVIILILLSSAGAYGLYYLSGQYAAIYSFDFETKKKEKLNKIIDAQSKPIHKLVSSYSRWSELARFIKDKNYKWAKNNLTISLKALDLDTISVYDSSYNLVYFYSVPGKNMLKNSPLPKKDLKSIFNDGKKHFYTKNKNFVLEIYTNQIYGKWYVSGKSKAKGYIAVSKVVDKSYTNNLSGLMDADVKINPALKLSDTSEDNKIVIRKEMKYWDKRTVSFLDMVFSEPLLAKALRNSDRILMFGLGLVLLAILFFSRAFTRFMFLPLSKILYGIREKSDEKIIKLKKSKSEFGEIANFVSSKIVKESPADTKSAVPVSSKAFVGEKEKNNTQELNQLKAQVSKITSLEVRTYLSSVREALKILLDEMAGEINDDQKEFVLLAKRNADKLNVLLNETTDSKVISPENNEPDKIT